MAIKKKNTEGIIKDIKQQCIKVSNVEEKSRIISGSCD
jgi:hypothetical protein